MTHRIFRLERVTNTSPAVGNKARQPMGPVTRLMGWIKTEVFTRYELVEQSPLANATEAATEGDAPTASDGSSTDGKAAQQGDSSEGTSPAPNALGRAQADSRRASPYPQLRVVVVQDGQGSRQHSSRMVISGRMADVCAELDRLAA